MAEYRNSNRILYPLGVTQEEKSAHILVQGHGEEVSCSYTGRARRSHVRRSRLIRNTGWEMSGHWNWIGLILHHLNIIS